MSTDRETTPQNIVDLAPGPKVGSSALVRLCADCKHCMKHDPTFPTGWDCLAPLRGLVDGHLIRANGSMPAWAARKEHCGIAGIYHEPNTKLSGSEGGKD